MKRFVSEETLNWLLGTDNPPVRYLVMKDIKKNNNDAELLEAKSKIMGYLPIKKILNLQNPDGGFATNQIVKRYGNIVAQSGYQPKHKATIWQLIFLTQFNADPEHPQIINLCNYILDNIYSEDYKTFGIYVQNKSGLYFWPIPCFAANMIWALSKMNFYKDERVQNSIKWLMKYQRFDDGDFITPNDFPYRGNKDRCFGKHSCHIGCTQVLKAFTVIPQKDRTPKIKNFIKKTTDFILLHQLYKKSKGKNRPIRKEYELLSFPVTYYDDLLQIVENLLFFKVKDKTIDKAIKFIQSKRTYNGTWFLENTPVGSSMLTKIESKGKESKWITYRALKVIKMYNELSAE